MKIFVNGDRHELEAATLALALAALGYGGKKIATAVNGPRWGKLRRQERIL